MKEGIWNEGKRIQWIENQAQTNVDTMV